MWRAGRGWLHPPGHRWARWRRPRWRRCVELAPTVAATQVYRPASAESSDTEAVRGRPSVALPEHLGQAAVEVEEARALGTDLVERGDREGVDEPLDATGRVDHRGCRGAPGRAGTPMDRAAVSAARPESLSAWIRSQRTIC